MSPFGDQVQISKKLCSNKCRFLFFFFFRAKGQSKRTLWLASFRMTSRFTEHDIVLENFREIPRPMFLLNGVGGDISTLCWISLSLNLFEISRGGGRDECVHIFQKDSNYGRGTIHRIRIQFCSGKTPTYRVGELHRETKLFFFFF